MNDASTYMDTPIPHAELWKKTPQTGFVAERFVRIESGGGVEVCMQYPKLKMRNAECGCHLRSEAAHMLFCAARALPRGHVLRIWDAWRPFALQQELYATYREQIIQQFGLQDVAEDERNAIISQYVAIPTENRDMPPAHTTGGAVDLTIVGPDGAELAMGTGFDAFTRKTTTDWFERASADDADAEVLRNRRLLYHAMCDAGFVNLPSEWWHYSYGDTNWARATGQPVRYGGCFKKAEFEIE